MPYVNALLVAHVRFLFVAVIVADDSCFSVKTSKLACNAMAFHRIGSHICCILR